MIDVFKFSIGSADPENRIGCIVHGILRELQTLLRRFSLGDVAEGHYCTDILTVLLHRGSRVLHRKARAVLSPEDFVIDTSRLPVVDARIHRAALSRKGRAVWVRVMDSCMHGLFNKFTRFVAEHCRSSWVDERGPALDIHAKDAFSDRTKNQARSFFCSCDGRGLGLRLLKKF